MNRITRFYTDLDRLGLKQTAGVIIKPSANFEEHITIAYLPDRACVVTIKAKLCNSSKESYYSCEICSCVGEENSWAVAESFKRFIIADNRSKGNYVLTYSNAELTKVTAFVSKFLSISRNWIASNFQGNITLDISPLYTFQISGLNTLRKQQLLNKVRSMLREQVAEDLKTML